MPTDYSFTVLGTPIGQGNLNPVPKRAGTDAGGKAIYDWKNPRLIHANAKDLHSWRQDVRHAALRARGDDVPAIERDIAVCVHVMFLFQRPVSAPKRVIRHTKAPDIDKLERALLDALTGISWVDDAQADEVHKYRRYAGGPLDPLGPAGTPRTVVRVVAQESQIATDVPLFKDEAAAAADGNTAGTKSQKARKPAVQKPRKESHARVDPGF